MLKANAGQVRGHAFVFSKTVSQVNGQCLSLQLNQFETGVTPAVKTKQGKQALFTSFQPFSLTENTSKRIELHPISAPITIILSLNISNSPAHKFTRKDVIKSLRWPSNMAPSWHTTSNTKTAPFSSISLSNFLFHAKVFFFSLVNGKCLLSEKAERLMHKWILALA